MPILVKDYTWTQTAKMVHIRVPINLGFRDNVDIFPTDSYIKAHFSPFLFEVFLLHDVDSKKSSCIVKDDLIILDLLKKEETEWECLEKDLTKVEKMKLKQTILEKCQEEAKQEAENRKIKKSQLDRFAVGQAMDIDTKQHALMDARRDVERNKAMDALEEWRVNATEKDKQLPFSSRNSSIKSNVIITELSPEEKNDVKIEEAPVVNENTVSNERKLDYSKIPKKDRIPPPIREVSRSVKTPVKSEYVEKKKEEITKRVLPKLRETAQLEIRHTPRTFPTPSRESTMEEEQTWLKNITLARRATGFVSEDLRPEEQDPQWCKEKGDEFFRNGNFLGAISAYTHGITLSDKLPSLFANRSATHFALGNFNKCLNDCSSALELMVPPCEGNRRSRAKCIARRAAALARLGYLSKAIDEMKAAAKLLPEDENIKKDVYDMERAWEQNPDSD